MCTAIGHVRFTPNSDRESEFPHKVMSALRPKVDMCGALKCPLCLAVNTRPDNIQSI
jgi:hypothetical protein